MWYCSGQSNMWLPVDHSLTRNDTVASINAGKFTNIRGMFGGSGNVPSGGAAYHPGGDGYGRKTGISPWMTAEQAISTGSSGGTAAAGGSYPLFKMGAACWYFGQRLSELGVEVPIGLADTAIGGQRIEEYVRFVTLFCGGPGDARLLGCHPQHPSRFGVARFPAHRLPHTVSRRYMNNATINKCTNRSSENIPWWDGELFVQQVLPFVDMTVKGWVWYQGENNMGAPKGNSLANLGYSCEQRELIRGWREVRQLSPVPFCC